MRSKKHLNEFWCWFSDKAQDIASEAHPELLDVLDTKLREVDPRLSWEIGPGRHEPWFLAISPNLDKDLADEARKVVAEAPEIQGWELYAMRQPKQWDYKVEIDEDGSAQSLSLDASKWQFVLLRYPDGLREVLLTSSNLPTMTENQRWQAAAIVLEGILGEQVMLEKIDEFELVPKLEPRFAEKQRPISALKGVIA